MIKIEKNQLKKKIINVLEKQGFEIKNNRIVPINNDKKTYRQI